jgi:hypothetical protein
MALVKLCIEDFENEEGTGVRAYIEMEEGREQVSAQSEKIAMCIGEMLPIINQFLNRERAFTLVEAGAVPEDAIQGE